MAIPGAGFSPMSASPKLGLNAIMLSPVTSDTTAAAITMTIAQFLSGLFLRDPNGAGRADLVPTAQSIMASIPGVEVGVAFEFCIRNDADASETITVTTNTGATLSGTMTIAQNAIKRFRLVVTNITPGSEAYTLYSLGSSTF